MSAKKVQLANRYSRVTHIVVIWEIKQCKGLLRQIGGQHSGDLTAKPERDISRRL